MQPLRQYGMVRVKRLLHEPDAYDGWRLNKRPPRLGDVGTIVDIFPGVDGGPEGYVVELSGPDGVSVWLSDFVKDELEPLDG